MLYVIEEGHWGPTLRREEWAEQKEMDAAKLWVGGASISDEVK